MKTFLARSAWAAEEGMRLDAATYASGGLEVRDRLTKVPWSWRRLDALSTVSVGSRFARVYVRDAQHGTPYITSSDMLLADLKGLLYLSNARTPQMSSLLIREGWTLISCSGTIGRTVYVRGEMDGLAASHDVIRCVPRTTEVQPGYLFAFLSTAQAQAMIRQKTYGNVVQHIEPEHIADMPVPIPDDAFQERIHGLVTRAAEARTEASRLLDEASGYFDSLAGPMPSKHQTAFAIALIYRSQVGTRLDAFHHIGWAAEPHQTGPALEDIADVWSVSSMRRVWADHGVPFGSGTNMFTVLPTPERKLARWAADEVSAYVAEGDVLLQAYGQLNGLIGRPAYVGKRSSEWAVGHLMLRVRCHEVSDRGRVFAFLRSESGRRMILKHSSGNQIPHLIPQALRQLPIPALPDHLLRGANEALALREQADADEEQAIREVEAWVG